MYKNIYNTTIKFLTPHIKLLILDIIYILTVYLQSVLRVSMSISINQQVYQQVEQPCTQYNLI